MEEPKEFYKIPEANLESLKARLEKLNKRAKKLGTPAVGLTVLKQYEQEVTVGTNTLDEPIKRLVRFYEVKVEGERPKINGWEFVAVIEPVVDAEGNTLGNVLRHVPGSDEKDLPEQYRKAENNCDHCHTARRRNATFILKRESDYKYVQVGRNCLRDFLGHADPDTLARWAEMLIEAHGFADAAEGEDFEGGARPIERFQAEEILGLTASAVRQYGWASNKAAREQFGVVSTSMTVGNWIHDSHSTRKEWKHKLEPLSEEDVKVAQEVSEWLKTLSSRAELNDYFYNLSLLGQGATFTEKEFGLACSAVPTYLREKEREINRAKQFESEKNSQHVGVVGERRVFERITLTYHNRLESDFGVTQLYKFRDEAGNVLVWFASSVYQFSEATEEEILADIRKQGYPQGFCKTVDIGDTITLLATVKAHNERNGIKQTIINRGAEYVSKEQNKARKKARKEWEKCQENIHQPLGNTAST